MLTIRIEELDQLGLNPLFLGSFWGAGDLRGGLGV